MNDKQHIVPRYPTAAIQEITDYVAFMYELRERRVYESVEQHGDRINEVMAETLKEIESVVNRDHHTPMPDPSEDSDLAGVC